MSKPSAKAYIIGLDIGTGSAKAVAITVSGKIIAHSQFYYATITSRSGYSEQDPEGIWLAFTSCIKNIIEQLQYSPLSISLSSAMHSLLLIDYNNKPITNLITWADTRSEQIAERLRQLPIAKSIYTETGTPIHSMSPLCKIKWFKESEPGLFQSAFKFVSIKEFIWHKLFNVWEVDHSIASATGLFNIFKLDWNASSLQLCSINAGHLSLPVATNFIRKGINKTVAGLMNISADTDFCIGASDGCLANIGSYSLEPGTATITIGTSGAVRIASAKPIINFNAMTFNYVLDEKTFICGGPVNNGGNVLPWIFQAFLKNSKPSEKDYTEFFKTVSLTEAGCKGLIFLPYIYGERAPVWDEKSCGIFFGIKPYHTNAFFLRAALEGICYSLYQVLNVIESSVQVVSQLNASGGFIHSEIWMQILANITGKDICITETEDASSIGAALLYMKATNTMSNYSSLRPVTRTIFKPDFSEHNVYKKYYSIFKQLYPTLSPIMHTLYST